MKLDFVLGGEHAQKNCDYCCKKKSCFLTYLCYLCDDVTLYCVECCEKRNLVVMCRCGGSEKMAHISDYYRDNKFIYEFINIEIILMENCGSNCEFCKKDDADEIVTCKCECGDMKKSYCFDCCKNNDITVSVCKKCMIDGTSESFSVSDYCKKGWNRYFVT